MKDAWRLVRVCGALTAALERNAAWERIALSAERRNASTLCERDALKAEVKRLQGMVEAYRAKRAVDGMNGRTWDAREHLRAEARVKRLEGELIPAEMVSAGWSAMIGNARARLLGIPVKLAPAVQACVSLPEIQSILKSQIHEVLQELAGDGLPAEVQELARVYVGDAAESA